MIKKWLKERGIFYILLAFIIGYIIYLIFIQYPTTEFNCMLDCRLLVEGLPNSTWDRVCTVTGDVCYDENQRYWACYRICTHSLI